MKDLERFGNLLFTEAAPFERFIMLIKRSYRVMSQRYSASVFETVHSMSKALDGVQRGGNPGIWECFWRILFEEKEVRER